MFSDSRSALSPNLAIMVHRIASPECNFDYWNAKSVETRAVVELNCLMPNGVFIILEAPRNATLSEIKEDLWDEAAKYPLHGMLKDASCYVFSLINNMAEHEEIHDENKRICDVKPFYRILRIVERQGDKADIILNSQISHLIGKGLHEFDHLRSSEVNVYRSNMKQLTTEAARERHTKPWIDKLCYQFPPRICPLSLSITREETNGRLREGQFMVVVKFETAENTFTLPVSTETTPTELLRMILNKKAITLHTSGEQTSDYVLKVCGQEEYLVGELPLLQFCYIQESLSRERTPVLVTVSVESVPLHDEKIYDNPDDLETRSTRSSFSTLTLRKKGRYTSSWNIRERFQFHVGKVSRINCDTTRPVEVGVQVGIFHGGTPLCECLKTSEKPVVNGEVEFEEDLVFNIELCNVPRMARVCLVIYEVKASKTVRTKRLKDQKQDILVTPLAWVNCTIYDYKNQLRGDETLYMWTYDELQTDEVLHPLGTVVSNPLHEHTSSVTVTIHRHYDNTIVFPSLERILEFANSNREEDFDREDDDEDTKDYNDHIKYLEGRDSLYEIHEQEKKVIWSHRYTVMSQSPDLLPKLLDCVEWGDRSEVAEATHLVTKWPLLPLEKALELLDYAYADMYVRKFAVKCLRSVPDDELFLYLLQLVQALKHESYLDCDLGEFLLRRALHNQKIGHYLFWHLRSEMQVAAVSVRFGLLLEAYCRGSQEHMKILMRQVQLLEKLKTTNELVRQRKDKDKAKSFLQEYLQESHCVEAMSGVHSPLNPSFKCKRVKVDKCRVMDSKMRPLWIVFENDDAYGDDIYIIFKYGDDLRQDMLTLQMIRVMDRLWKKAGLDLRMNPYGCISTDNRVGLIEVVLNAETIANIQKEKGMFSATSAFRRGSLLAWLKDYNQNDLALKKAIEEFTFSCAGYCVATYVLGVADRHSDNIMVKKSGPLFHIDFGHILGHFKEKFGFRRERVPFVLTHDFVHVINKGQKDAHEFQVFQTQCERAFLILRQHGSLILSLFAMMISTGLPELSSEKDVNYLRETLVLDLTEEDAIKHFRSKFGEALANSWKTSLNWASHNLAKNNK
ncbi:hypothetical protein WDU94_014720 [Cyamophila willieti]